MRFSLLDAFWRAFSSKLRNLVSKMFLQRSNAVYSNMCKAGSVLRFTST